MISVENFYWVLTESLLRPAGLNCEYHYPFGSRQNLSAFEYTERDQKLINHVLFYYDQEPIYTTEISEHYDKVPMNWSNRVCRILANSEHSKIKKSLCQQRQMLDWYFFYHGFAALDWFRDAQYVNSSVDPTKVYLNLNHQVQHYRSYRISLLARLAKQNLLKYGSNSFHGNWSVIQQEISDSYSLMSPGEKALAHESLESISLPLTIDSCNVTPYFSAQFGFHDMQMWQKSFFHVVNETVFYQDKLHLTEKIFKPIVASRPFILVAASGNLSYLRSYGFQTFGDWIDESYDHETDPGLRLDMITKEIQKLCDMSRLQLSNLLKDMQSVLLHNKNHFFGDFKKIILREMLDNFAHCITQWNNGRLESSVRIPDLDQVYEILIQR